MLLVPVFVEAQTGQVTLKGIVSETVALSVRPDLIPAKAGLDVVRTGNTIRITWSSDDSKGPVIRVPLLVRSNSSFKLSAKVESATAMLTQLSVIDVRATGRLVSPQAVNGLNVPQQFEMHGSNESSPLDISRPLIVVSGPRVSLGGTLESPDNALEITVLIGVRPEPGHRWMVQLTFSGTAE
ncbi:MAG TPA: hypothetical protein VLB68_16670 [Pyrinomonadaceae bacterium]|nr:hypothetical protein [Pyrinomonadaceae bacterium]